MLSSWLLNGNSFFACSKKPPETFILWCLKAYKNILNSSACLSNTILTSTIHWKATEGRAAWPQPPAELSLKHETDRQTGKHHTEFSLPKTTLYWSQTCENVWISLWTFCFWCWIKLIEFSAKIVVSSTGGWVAKVQWQNLLFFNEKKFNDFWK